MPKNYSVLFTQRQTAQLIASDFNEQPQADEIIGRSLVSIISSGSETGGFMYSSEDSYPCSTGYACIMEVLETGSGVTGLHAGDYVYTPTPHQLYTRTKADRVFRITEEIREKIPVEKAIISRFPAVSMTTLVHTRIKPTETVLVSGLGIVGLMCAQAMQCCGYRVYAFDPHPDRRRTASLCGLTHVGETVTALGIKEKSAGLAIDCSGNELAVMAMLPYIRQGGEVALVGVPWKRTSETFVHDFLYQIFYSYLHVYSGWEWSLPLTPGEFDPNCNFASMQTALRWIAEGSIRTDDIYELHDPRDCGCLYPAIAAGSLSKPCVIFDWRRLSESQAGKC